MKPEIGNWESGTTQFLIPISQSLKEMANYTTTADVVLSVNGKQAQKMLSTLEKDAQRLEKQLAKAATAGDSSTQSLGSAKNATMKKLQREYVVLYSKVLSK